MKKIINVFLGILAASLLFVACSNEAEYGYKLKKDIEVDKKDDGSLYYGTRSLSELADYPTSILKLELKNDSEDVIPNGDNAGKKKNEVSQWEAFTFQFSDEDDVYNDANKVTWDPLNGGNSGGTAPGATWVVEVKVSDILAKAGAKKNYAICGWTNLNLKKITITNPAE